MKTLLSPTFVLTINVQFVIYFSLNNSGPDFTSIRSLENNTLRSGFLVHFLQEQDITTNCHILSDDCDNFPWRNKLEVTFWHLYPVGKYSNWHLYTIGLYVWNEANIPNCIVFNQQGFQDRISLLLFSHSSTDPAFAFYLFHFSSEKR